MCCVLSKCTWKWDCITVCACNLWTRYDSNFDGYCQRVIKIQLALLSLYSVVGSVLLCMCVRGGLQSKLKTIYKSAVASPGGGGGGRGNVPPKPGKFAKDGKQFAPQPAVSLKSNKKLKFLLMFKNFIKLFSKTFKFFLKKLSKFSIKLLKFLQIFKFFFSKQGNISNLF